MKRKILGFLTAMSLTVNLVPFAAVAVEEHENQVHVIVENTTFTPDSEDWDDKFWYGTLTDTWVDINDDSTMMSCIVDAIESAGYTQEGAENNYISYINGMGEFDGGFMSGWMGTLNDWFTNEGFGSFSVADGKLEAGDEIRVMYTCAYGDDLGGSWGNSDSTIKDIVFDKGTIFPAFDKDIHEYTLTVSSDTDSVLVTPTASNKNYQVRTRIGDTVYKRTAQIPVNDGTEIIVECNYEGSLSMNPNGETQTYTINVAKEITTTSTTITTSTTTTSTTTTSTTTAEPVTTTTASHIASDDDLCSWAIKDYQSKTGVTASSAELTVSADGTYVIELSDESGKLLDTYTIDPETGIGTDSANEEVNLPQTGNNSLNNIFLVLGAFMIIGFGIFAVRASGCNRRKEDK